MPISWAINVTELLYCTMAMITEIRIKTTIRQRIVNTCFFSSMFLIRLSLIRSRARVELDAMTSEDSVDIEADRTRITTIPMSREGRSSSMVGIIES